MNTLFIQLRLPLLRRAEVRLREPRRRIGREPEVSRHRRPTLPGGGRQLPVAPGLLLVHRLRLDRVQTIAYFRFVLNFTLRLFTIGLAPRKKDLP